MPDKNTETWRHQKVLENYICGKAKIKLLILDVDGVLTDGTKIYNENHSPIYKKFRCKDFTAIKRFVAAGIKVVMLSGDNWNKEMAQQRNIPFYCTRGKDLSLDKSVHLSSLEETMGYFVKTLHLLGMTFLIFLCLRTYFGHLPPLMHQK